MELPTTVSGILRRSPEMRRDSQLYDETGQSSPTFQDKGSVRFVDEERMNSKLLGMPLEKVRFNYDRNEIDNGDEEIDEDYSASVSAILQRRASTRRGKRRSSSPFSHEDFSTQSSPRRRSSAFTTTSETAISIDDPNLKEEQIFENIRLHKEVIANVKHQPWPIRRKLKLIQQAKSYIKRHEGELQVRLKQSRSTRDIWTRFNIVLVKKWNHTKRELINFMNLLIPWELRIKEIESHFGTVVASYFTFLRWLFWVNLVTSIILAAFVIVPEILLNKNNKDDRKILLKEERTPSWDMLLNIDGILKHSPLFYGWYLDCAQTGKYKVPTAYFMIGIGVYIYSFIATLRKMAVNFRLSKLSEKEDECIFTWKLFSGWDYMIGNAETGHNRTSSIVLGFKEALLEEAEKKKEKRSWKIISIRVFVNLNVIWMLIFSARAVIYVVNKSSNDREANSSDSFFVNWWYQNETTVVMTVISSVFPFIFEVFGLVEKYHPRKTLRIQLARIMALNLLNLYTLTFALFSQIDGMTKELEVIKHDVINATTAHEQLINITSPQYTNPLLGTSYPSWTNHSDPFIGPSMYQPVNKQRVKREFQYADFPYTRTTSLKDHFLRNQGEFTDPATGKYNKPIPITTNPQIISILMKTSSSSPRSPTTTIYSTTSNITTTNNITVKNTSISTQESETATLDSKTEIESTSLFLLPTENSSSTNDDLLTDENMTDFDLWTLSNENMTEKDYNFTAIEIITTDNWSEYLDNLTTVYSYEPMSEKVTEPTRSTSPVVARNISNFTTQTASLVTSSLPQTSKFITQSTTMATYITTTGTVTESTPTPKPTIIITTSTLASNTSAVTPRLETPTVTCTNTEKIENFCVNKPVMDYSTRLRMRKLCWETMFGQELVKLTIMDLVSSFVSTFFGDFIRALLVRYMNKIWCWDLEKKFPKYADFKIAENILHLVNNQGLVWMGMFFSPGLPLINVVKLMIMMYLRSWAVLTCNVPHEVVFRASRSNNFYLALLLTMLFLCVLPVCYAIVWLTPSWHCGPFSGQPHIYKIFATTLLDILPKNLHNIMEYMASPGTVIPLIIILLLVIYYLASLTSALREANIDLKVQLRRERTEERKKMFQMASRRKRGGSDIDSTFAKWKKILQEVPSIKMSDDSQFPDFLDDHRRDDTDVDNGFLKHDEDEDKLRKIFKLKCKPENAVEDKWDALLKMVPKTSPKVNVKDSSSTTSSLKDDSSAPSEAIPEIKISRVQTMENILKAEAAKPKQQRKSSQSSEKDKNARIKIKPSILEKWQQKRKEVPDPIPVPPPSSANVVSQPVQIDLDDVFLESVVVDVPELPKIQDSISNRIKRRLRKVISVGSSGESPTSSDFERKSTEQISQSSAGTKWDIKKEPRKAADDLSKTVRLRQTLENTRQQKLLKADSWHTVLGEKLPERLEKRRRSSLSDLNNIRPDE